MRPVMLERLWCSPSGQDRFLFVWLWWNILLIFARNYDVSGDRVIFLANSLHRRSPCGQGRFLLVWLWWNILLILARNYDASGDRVIFLCLSICSFFYCPSLWWNILLNQEDKIPGLHEWWKTLAESHCASSNYTCDYYFLLINELRHEK
jgi:hypothetical protein